MKRKLVLVVLVVLVALLATTPALAAGPGGGKGQQHRQGGNQGGQSVRQSFSLVGIITALNGTITVEVYSGNRLAQPYIGQALTVQLTGSTRYRQWQPGGCVPISLGDVQVGDTASIQGLVSGGIFTAQRVTVDVPCCTR